MGGQHHSMGIARFTARAVLFLFLFFQPCSIQPCLAEVRTDGTLGAQVSLGGPDFSVTSDLGQIHGGNLYHSFQEFNIQAGESATFSGPVSIENIISRVTGGNASIINGTLRSTIEGADFFLLNPNGVMFGPLAQLDIKGSFHASTADYLRLADGAVFQADPARQSVLSVARPEAFGFLSDNPAAISVDDAWLSVVSGETFSLVGGDLNIAGDQWGARINAPQGRLQLVGVGKAGEVNLNAPELLYTPAGQTGTISISDAAISDASDAAGTVIIKGGRIQVIDTSVAAEGTRIVDTTDPAVDLESATQLELSGYSSILCFSGRSHKGGDLRLKAEEFTMRDTSWIDVIAADQGPGGDIRIDTQTLTLEGETEIRVSSYAGGASGSIQIDAAEGISLTDAASIKSLAKNQGDGGDIRIKSKALRLNNSAYIYSSSPESGTCGSIHIDIAGELSLANASSIEIEEADRGSGGNIGIGAQSLSLESGSRIKIISKNEGKCGSIQIDTLDMLSMIDDSAIGIYAYDQSEGGDIAIDTKSLNIEEGASIWNISYGSGNSGAILIESSDAVTIHGSGHLGLSAGIKSGTYGTVPAGEISVITPFLYVWDNGTIFSTSSGAGISGAITLTADTIRMDDGSVSSSGYSGDSGDIHILANTLEASNGSEVTAKTTGTGNAGTIKIVAERVLLDGSYIDNFAKSGSSGNGGDIDIDTHQLTIKNNAMIESESRGDGHGGNISIKAKELTLIGLAGGWANRIAASSYATGDAGNVRIDISDTLNMSDGATVATDACGTGEGGNIHISAGRLHLLNGATVTARSTGAGNAGNVFLNAISELYCTRSTINTEATRADGGNIQIRAGHMTCFTDSDVKASVGGGAETTGGNVDLQSQYIILQDSRVSANAYEGRGGNINITADAYLADPETQVDASSEKGIHGIVDIDAPFSNLSGSLKPLPKEFLSAANLLKKPCEARVRGGDYGSFIVRGRDALPAEPGSLQMSPPQEF